MYLKDRGRGKNAKIFLAGLKAWSWKLTERAQARAFKPGVSVLGCFGFNSLHSRCTPGIRVGKLAPSAEPLSNDGRCWNKRESASVGMLRHSSQGNVPQSGSPVQEKDYPA